jgi:methylenetetrahydrofolate dehydrogenase (NADP+) / methenyltetrahydrofolate cyclohydrolase
LRPQATCMLILDGKHLAGVLVDEIALEVQQRVEKGLKIPHLAAVLVGDNPASKSYVSNKIKSCARAGYVSTMVTPPADVSQAELMQIVLDLNNNPEIDGFIVQLPLPKHIDEQAITLAIDPKKDVDGFHPYNFGLMALGVETLLPATPFGIMLLLKRYGISTAGKTCVVIGRSNIVGTPISIMLGKKGDPGDCTVTLAHSRTPDLAKVIKRADIVIAAIGKPHFVTADMVKKGAIVIDVGINSIADATTKSGYRLVGDVDYAGLAHKVKAMTPVPGGVGPMTVAALMLNTMKAVKGREKK